MMRNTIGLCRVWKGLPCAGLVLLLLFAPRTASSYSVLTHEALVDALWDSGIRPLLLKRFAAATGDELAQAHAYAYGGSIIQDLGYYPFGSRFYSDLTHYARGGDFILNLIRESEDLNEYAFALGALSHYAADNSGHSMATNRAVPLLFPELRRKFGNTVTYADDPFSHSKTEFSFDVYQASRGRYASDAYKGFIGFQVSKPVLERAFLDTYGMKIEQVFLDLDLAIGSYRRAVGTILPALTKIAWQIKRKEIMQDAPGITRRKFLYNLSRSSYQKNWGSTYYKPSAESRMLATFFHIVPRIGPFKALAFRSLTPETEKLFMSSFNSSVDRYRLLLAGTSEGAAALPNENLDVGEATKAGSYTLADAVYAKLLHKLHGRYGEIPQDLRSDLLTFYGNLSLPIATKSNADAWATLQNEVGLLRAIDNDIAAAGPHTPAVILTTLAKRP